MKSNKFMCAAAMCAALAAVPAEAAECWDADQVGAARVRDLQSKMMVAALQCRVIGIDMAPAYNGFIRTNRSRLESINATIKARFAGLYGGQGQFHYDKFTTSLANAFGADRTDAGVCATMIQAAHEAEAISGDLPLLLDLADRVGVAPRLPGGRCGVSTDGVRMAAVLATGATLPAAGLAAGPATDPSAEASAAVPQPAGTRPVLTLAALTGDAID